MRKVSLILVLFSVCGIGAFSKDWNGIKPCVSTRSEVEKILGRDEFPAPDSLGSYSHKNARVTVYYERKDKGNPEGNLVQRLHIYPDEKIPLLSYLKNKKMLNFRKSFRIIKTDDRVSHVYGLAYYRNVKEGFEIQVQKNDKDLEVITGFSYFDPADSC